MPAFQAPVTGDGAWSTSEKVKSWLPDVQVEEGEGLRSPHHANRC